MAENGVSLEDEDVENLMKAYDSLSTFPDVGTALTRLASNQNIECVVFSNGTKQMVTQSVRQSKDLSPHSEVFKDIVTVDFVRTFKPAPEVYKYLAHTRHMAGKEDRMWLVSGNPFDVVGARAVGMQAAWVDRAGNGWQDQLGAQPTVVVRSLDEVAAAGEEHARK